MCLRKTRSPSPTTATWSARAAPARATTQAPKSVRLTMSTPDRTAHPERPEAVELDECGVPLTVEGARRAKAKLAEAAARHTPERRAALLRRLGLPVDAA